MTALKVDVVGGLFISPLQPGWASQAAAGLPGPREDTGPRK